MVSLETLAVVECVMLKVIDRGRHVERLDLKQEVKIHFDPLEAR